jgi:hypothetical protein
MSHDENPENPWENGHSPDVASKSPAVSEEIVADLRGVIDAWPDLPEAVKAGIVAMVRASNREG